MRGTDNLQSYIGFCRLPELRTGPSAPAMPPPGHKSHLNHLQITSERPRRLEHIQSTFGNMEFVREWTIRAVPPNSLDTTDEDPNLGETLTLPSAESFAIQGSWHRPAEDLHKIGDWLEDFPLVTVQRILHLVNSRTERWGFKRAHDTSADRDIIQHFLWSKLESPMSTPISQELKAMIQSKSVVVAFQPPWVLSPDDMKQFANCEFPHNCIDMKNMTSKERLWAKLWDICVSNDVHYFVLTTYNQWIFGAFDSHWTTGFISRIFQSDSDGPTIAEALAYWIASAMRLTGFILPKVALSRPLTTLVKPPQAEGRDNFIPDASESNWTGKSDDVASSAGYRASSVSSRVSDAGVFATSAPMHQPMSESAIKLWLDADSAE